MALIKCSNCGMLVSDHSSSCPKCNTPLSRNTQQSQYQQSQQYSQPAAQPTVQQSAQQLVHSTQNYMQQKLQQMQTQNQYNEGNAEIAYTMGAFMTSALAVAAIFTIEFCIFRLMFGEDSGVPLALSVIGLIVGIAMLAGWIFCRIKTSGLRKSYLEESENAAVIRAAAKVAAALPLALVFLWYMIQDFSLTGGDSLDGISKDLLCALGVDGGSSKGTFIFFGIINFLLFAYAVVLNVINMPKVFKAWKIKW